MQDCRDGGVEGRYVGTLQALAAAAMRRNKRAEALSRVFYPDVHRGNLMVDPHTGELIFLDPYVAVLELLDPALSASSGHVRNPERMGDLARAMHRAGKLLGVK